MLGPLSKKQVRKAQTLKHLSLLDQLNLLHHQNGAMRNCLRLLIVLVRKSLKSAVMIITSGEFPENLEYPQSFRFTTLHTR